MHFFYCLCFQQASTCQHNSPRLESRHRAKHARYALAQVNARAIARKAEDVKKNGDVPLLELTFGQRGKAKVMGAVVKVHGVMSSNRYLPVDERSGEDMTQTFDLGGAAGLTDTSVWVTKLSYVDWAEVTELRYADGSSWHASSKVGCRAVPSKLRLIDATASSAIR